jgi:putative ABC transport system permease protein
MSDPITVRWLEEAWFDLRYGLRTLARNPGFAAVAIVSLGLGIGATTAIYSVLRAVALRPLPYRDAGRLAMLWTDDPKHDVHEEGVSYPNFLDWREQSRAFEDMAICSRPLQFTLFGADESERLSGVLVSQNFFDFLGVAPALGRAPSLEEFERGETVVLLSHGLWQRRFGASPAAVGSRVVLDGRPYRVIGVMPRNFRFPDIQTDLWQPLTAFDRWSRIASSRYGDWGRVLARLRPGLSFAQAQIEMDTIGRRLAAQYPVTDPDFAGFGVNVVPLIIQVTGENTRLALTVLLGAVVVVLLVACANVCNLTLARGTARQRELAVRAALGAGQGRLIRQIVTESALLALVGAAAGMAVARGSLSALVALGGGTIARADEIRIDGGVLAVTAGLSVFAALLVGLAPALLLVRGELESALRGSGRGSSESAGRRRMHSGLVVAEFALAVVLLAGAGLLFRSFLKVLAVDPGLRPDHVLTLRLSLQGQQVLVFYQQVLDRARSLPGVVAAGLTEDVLQRRNPDLSITVEGRPAAPSIALSDEGVSPGLFEALRVPLLRGRFFTDADVRGGLPVAIVNQTMARHFWPGEDPIGKRFKPGSATSRDPWLTVVGMAADVRRQGLEHAPCALYFRPLLGRNMDLVVRAASDPLGLARAVREEIRAVDKTVAVYGVTTLENQLAELTAPRRFQTLLVTLFAALALGLAAVGVYGVLHYAVARRTQEIGIRMALGARAGNILRTVLGQGLGLAGAGVALGLVAASWLTQLLSSLLFGVGATDPATFVAAPLVLLAVAAAASLIPARRATKVDPLEALRCE